MSAKLAILLVVARVLFLLMVVPCGALAQSLQTASPDRQRIVNQLQHLRLGFVRYDNLSLAEVVRNLTDESRKSDPEKTGISFVIHSNNAAGSAPIDAGAVRIRINPQLTDVRLADVLDAVVKVADYPIEYKVEDDNVVFSFKEVRPSAAGFVFPGGTPIQFLDAVQKQYQVDWVSVADIPKDMEEVRIPRLRLNETSVQPILARAEGRVSPLAALVSLYNQLGEQKPELGRLIVKGDLANPAVVSFVPDQTTVEARPKIKVQAFSIYGMSDAEEGKLWEDIERARTEAMDYAYNVRGYGFSDPKNLQGTVAIHKDTSLLVAIGPEPFVQMVESIVNAFHAKALEMGSRASSSGAASGK